MPWLSQCRWPCWVEICVELEISSRPLFFSFPRHRGDVYGDDVHGDDVYRDDVYGDDVYAA